MYVPSHFAADDADVRALLESHGAADLITATDDGLVATFLPFNAPPRFINGQLRAIVGLELVIARIEAKLKLSQNRPATDIDGVLAGLEGTGNVATAAATRQANRQEA
jgi:transcriptional regulator